MRIQIFVLGFKELNVTQKVGKDKGTCKLCGLIFSSRVKNRAKREMFQMSEEVVFLLTFTILPTEKPSRR